MTNDSSKVKRKEKTNATIDIKLAFPISSINIFLFLKSRTQKK